jgi:hypothetical protein
MKTRKVSGKSKAIKEKIISPVQSDLDVTPYFSFDKIHKNYNLECIQDTKQQAAFILHICKESGRTWKEIRSDSNYKAFGMEQIKQNLCDCVSNLIPIGKVSWAFHYYDYFAFVGYVDGRVFHIVGIDSNKGCCYEHSKT